MCDAYEAMTADRSYRRARSSEAACDELRASAGTQFDPEVVDVFVLEISGRGTADAETTNETEWPVQALSIAEGEIGASPAGVSTRSRQEYLNASCTATVTSQPRPVLLRSTSGRRLSFSHAVWDVRQRIAGVPTG